MRLKEELVNLTVFLTDTSGITVDDIPEQMLDNRTIDRFLRLKSIAPRKGIQTAAANLLARYIVRDFGEVKIGRGQFGKPYYVDLPLRLSVSHSSEAVAVSLSTCEHGTDIERIRDYPEKIIDYVLSSDERELYAKAEECEKNRLFTDFFTRKESFVKMGGRGFENMPKDIVFSDDCRFYTSHIQLAGETFSVTICAKNDLSVDFRIVPFKDLLKF